MKMKVTDESHPRVKNRCDGNNVPERTRFSYIALWFRTAKNQDVRTGLLACPFARSLAPLTGLLTPQSALLVSIVRFAALTRLFAISGKVDD